MLCQYKDVLGKPNEGIHRYRVFNIAIVDVLLTIMLSFFISWLFSTEIACTLLVIFLLGILLHRIFCVNTTINTAIFGTI